MFYKKSSFNFTDKSQFYIKNIFKDLFISNFCHDLRDIVPDGFLITPPGKELVKYFFTLGLLKNIKKIQVFVSNLDTWYIGNPHVDLTHDNIPSLIKSRFNILVLGNPADQMHWWKEINSIDQLKLQEYTYFNGGKYFSYGIPGDTIDQRWTYLGPPTCSIADLLTTSAFVKTNCVHTVNVSPGPRLVITAILDIDLEDIII